MILFAIKKVRKLRKLAHPNLENICEDSHTIAGLNTAINKQSIFCTKKPTECIYQSTEHDCVVSYEAKFPDGSKRCLPMCMLAPDYESQATEAKK